MDNRTKAELHDHLYPQVKKLRELSDDMIDYPGLVSSCWGGILRDIARDLEKVYMTS